VMPSVHYTADEVAEPVAMETPAAADTLLQLVTDMWLLRVI